jgi:hypothetical protein
MNGRRLLLSGALFSLIATGCNLSDDEPAVVSNNQVEQTNNATNSSTNNITNNATNNATNNTTNNTTNNGTNNAAPVSVVFTEKRINNVVTDAGQAVASSSFEVAAQFTTTNSSACPDCPIQVILEENGNLNCLSDQTAGDSTGTIILLAPDLIGGFSIFYHVMEEASCDAAIEKITQSSTSLFGMVEVVEGLTLTDVLPAPDSKDVPVDKPIQINASKAVEADSAQGNVLLFKSGTPVPITLSVNGAVITATPEAVLEEFQTEYTLVVKADLKSIDGTTLGSDNRLTFTTVTLAEGRKYAIRNAYHGQAYDLAVGTDNNCQLASNLTRQDSWMAAQFPLGGFYLHSANRGVGFALEGSDGANPCLIVNTVGASGQSWRFVKSGGGFLMQTNFQGPNRALDATKASPDRAKPLMTDLNGESNQIWNFTAQ